MKSTILELTNKLETITKKYFILKNNILTNISEDIKKDFNEMNDLLWLMNNLQNVLFENERNDVNLIEIMYRDIIEVDDPKLDELING